MTWRMMVPFSPRGGSLASDPFAGLQRQLGSMFDGLVGVFPEGVASATLKLDVKEDDKAFHVAAELPGLSEKEVDVTFADGMLTIRGEKKVERDEKQDTWHIVERSTGSFLRQLSMPTNVDEEKIEAKFDKGVLTVTLPKMAEAKSQAKKIEVKAS
ncbi:MAG: Hsp20/alpha crystallin family protein [Alphaproteobacteria bacterium]|nr:Hsp20/alpha crystallin family protein [Alphaproteobacteria bacterium]